MRCVCAAVPVCCSLGPPRPAGAPHQSFLLRHLQIATNEKSLERRQQWQQRRRRRQTSAPTVSGGSRNHTSTRDRMQGTLCILLTLTKASASSGCATVPFFCTAAHINRQSRSAADSGQTPAEQRRADAAPAPLLHHSRNTARSSTPVLLICCFAFQLTRRELCEIVSAELHLLSLRVLEGQVRHGDCACLL